MVPGQKKREAKSQPELACPECQGTGAIGFKSNILVGFPFLCPGCLGQGTLLAYFDLKGPNG